MLGQGHLGHSFVDRTHVCDTSWGDCIVIICRSVPVLAVVTDMALKEAKKRSRQGVKVFNFNVEGGGLNCNGADVCNVYGPSQVTLPLLVEEVKARLKEKGEGSLTKRVKT